MTGLTTPDLRAQADEILVGLSEAASAVAPERRTWWSNYLVSHRPHFLNLLDLVRECGEPATLLDVGNFPGHFTILMRRLGLEVSGVDLEPERAGSLWIDHGIDERRADIEVDPLPFPDESFDVVVLAEVFEHLRINPIFALRECFRVVKAGGHLILSVPNVSARHRIRFFLGRDYQGDIIAEFESLETVGHMGHFRLYSRREMSRIVEYIGGEVVRMRIAGWLPTGRWRFVRYLPYRDRWRSHVYVLARRPTARP